MIVLAKTWIKRFTLVLCVFCISFDIAVKAETAGALEDADDAGTLIPITQEDRLRFQERYELPDLERMSEEEQR